MNVKWWMVGILSGLVAGLTVYWMISITSKSNKEAYILTQKVFDNYQGTIELKKKIAKQEEKQHRILDSMVMEVKKIEIKYGDTDIRSQKANMKYQHIYQEILRVNREQMQKYTDGIWEQINQHVGAYGREKGYQFIYGANGNGSIMFADSTKEISKEIIPFINSKYSGN